MANKLKGIPKAKDHSELSGGFLPHSWSFLGGRGFQLGVTAQNELGTLGTSAAIGSISGEGTGFASLGIDYRKYVPIYSFGIDRADRNFLINGKTSSWTETKSYFGVNIPFFNSPGFYNELLNLQINTGIISSTDNDYTSDAKLDDETLIANSIGLTSSYQKALRYQGIQPEWGYTASLQYTDLSNNDSGNTNFLGQYNFTFYTPGFLENHGFNFNFTGEFGPENEELYQLQNEYVPLLGYLFSRGYATEFTSKFDRVSLNYVFPIAYPKFGFSDWIYFPRVYAQAFVDYTKYRNIDLDDRTLGSYGTEFIFDTNILRKIPMSFALRFLHNQREGQNTIEFYISNVF
jgi:hypothetical protein